MGQREDVMANLVRGDSRDGVPVGEPSLHKLGVARQGWRARLANVERLLDEALLGLGEPGPEYARGVARAAERTSLALSEVRAMLDDPGGTA